jgi:fumarylacetoacetase
VETLNETHDPALRSWVESANRRDTDFPIQNLPLAIFRRGGRHEPYRGGVAIGDEILDLSAAARAGAFTKPAAAAAETCGAATLNDFMAMGRGAWSSLRLAVSRALRAGHAEAQALAACLVPQREAEFAVPARIGDYTDFYASIHHATNVGKQFRPDNPLLPNYKWVPVGYHGRASSIGISGEAFPRPAGQTMLPGAERPELGPSTRLDYEVELGIFIGTGNPRGRAIALDEAESHVFGLCLLNDWSARDIQAWEYQPLGPFLSKNFATTISPWIVTLEALAPFRVPFTRASEDPPPLRYLDSPGLRAAGGLDIRLEVALESARMRDAGATAVRIAHTNYAYAYWTLAQLVAHHTVNGCNLEPGDLLGTGTLSGPGADEAGALLELTRGGKAPIRLPDGESRTFLEDGDAVILHGWCARPGAARLGFGECRGVILPAVG